MEHYDEQVEKSYQSILNKQDVSREEYMTDLDGKVWKKAIINLDGNEKMHIATDGNTVRIMTMKHEYIEVKLVFDRMYHIFGKSQQKVQDFIKKDEMII